MPKGSTKKAGCLVAPNATPQAELQRHIAVLKLSNTSEYQAWCRAQGFGTGLHKNWRQRREEVAAR